MTNVIIGNESEITRVEIIDEKGRSYVNWDKDNKVVLMLQDNGRTLKIYIHKKQKKRKTADLQNKYIWY